VQFSAPAVLNTDSFLETNVLLENLGTFPNWRMELSPVTSNPDSDDYKATLRLTERNGWGSSFLDGAISLLRGGLTTPFSLRITTSVATRLISTH